MSEKIGWIVIEMKCVKCEHEWVLVAPYDIVIVTCPECKITFSMDLIVDHCDLCLRVIDETITGVGECALCGMPIFQDERRYLDDH